MNNKLKGARKKVCVSYLNILTQNLCKGAEENHELRQSVWSVSGQRFEPIPPEYKRAASHTEPATLYINVKGTCAMSIHLLLIQRVSLLNVTILEILALSRCCSESVPSPRPPRGSCVKQRPNRDREAVRHVGNKQL